MAAAWCLSDQSEEKEVEVAAFRMPNVTEQQEERQQKVVHLLEHDEEKRKQERVGHEDLEEAEEQLAGLTSSMKVW